MKKVDWKTYRAEIEAFSSSQNEPEWMLQIRLAALEKMATLELPFIERVRIKRWPLTQIETAFATSEVEQGNIPDFTQMANNPLVVQIDSTTVMEQIPAELAEQGVIFTDFATALQEHPELVKEAYEQQVVPYDENQLTAFNTAFMNSGVFLYVPKNVEVEVPFEAHFLHQANSQNPFVKHVYVLAEENSRFDYIERFHTIGDQAGATKQTGSIIAEVIAKPGSHISYSGVDQLGKKLTSYINRRGLVQKDATLNWAIGVMNDGDVIADFDTDLVENGANSEMRIVSISAGKQTQGIDTRVTNKAPYTNGNIIQNGVAKENGTLTFNGIGHILKGANGAEAQQSSRVLMMSDTARADANPILLIDENDVIAGHAASVGQVDPDEMFYLMSRGLHKEEAERLVIRGFLGAVITTIPDKAIRTELINVIEGKLDS